uniref:Uncharacterized protein n=1 Tax=Romanomermis culicivorax TaxID=13658 RepID=A0A915JPA5_ROMCU
ILNNSITAYIPISADYTPRNPPKEFNTLLKRKRKLWNKLQEENVGDVKQKYNQCLPEIKQYTYSQKLNTERKIPENKNMTNFFKFVNSKLKE